MTNRNSWLLCMGCFLLSLSGIAQNKIPYIDKNNLIFKSNHFSFEFNYLWAIKSDIDKVASQFSPSSSAVPGAKFGLLYHINFGSKNGLVTGGEVNLIGTNSSFSFHKNDFSPHLNRDYTFSNKETRVSNLVLSVPILFEKRFWYTKKSFISAGAGVRINYSLGADFDTRQGYAQTVNGDYIQVVEVDTYDNNNAKPWLSYVFSVGNSWRLKNNNLLQLGVTANVSFTKYVNGSYTITVPNQPTTSGAYSSTGTYVGLYLRYSLTNGNYWLRKWYEQHSKASL